MCPESNLYIVCICPEREGETRPSVRTVVVIYIGNVFPFLIVIVNIQFECKISFFSFKAVIHVECKLWRGWVAQRDAWTHHHLGIGFVHDIGELEHTFVIVVRFDSYARSSHHVPCVVVRTCWKSPWSVCHQCPGKRFFVRTLVWLTKHDACSCTIGTSSAISGNKQIIDILLTGTIHWWERFIGQCKFLRIFCDFFPMIFEVVFIVSA